MGIAFRRTLFVREKIKIKVFLFKDFRFSYTGLGVDTGGPFLLDFINRKLCVKRQESKRVLSEYYNDGPLLPSPAEYSQESILILFKYVPSVKLLFQLARFGFTITYPSKKLLNSHPGITGNAMGINVQESSLPHL